MGGEGDSHQEKLGIKKRINDRAVSGKKESMNAVQRESLSGVTEGRRVGGM